jgi:hypothetical protein
MIRTTVYLDEEDKRLLAVTATATGTSEAELIRRGIRMVLASGEVKRPRTAYAHSHDSHSARDTEDLLASFGQ